MTVHIGCKHKEQHETEVLHENNDNLENTMNLSVLGESRDKVSLHSALEKNEEISTKDKNAHNEYFVSESMLTNQPF